MSEGEVQDDLVNEAKGLTWEREAEHALIELEGGRLALIGGGRKAIEFRGKGEGSGLTLHMEIGGREVRVIQLLWHTHPVATGPSDHDLNTLAILGQDESIIPEIGGQRDGTRIRPKPGTTPD